MIRSKDILTDSWGATWKVLGVEDDVVYLECIADSFCPETVGEDDIAFLSDIEEQ